jgi:hypothetical protein
LGSVLEVGFHPNPLPKDSTLSLKFEQPKLGHRKLRTAVQIRLTERNLRSVRGVLLSAISHGRVRQS